MSLPRQIQNIIDEALPIAMKYYSELKNKEKGLTSIDNHINSHTLPRSIQLKLELVVPKIFSTFPELSETADQAKQAFRESLEQFQATAITQMRIIAAAAVEAQQRTLKEYLEKIDQDIILFYYRLLDKLDPPLAALFKAEIETFPNMPEQEYRYEINEVREFIAAWRKSYSAGLHSKLAKEVEKEIHQERKLAAKEAAEDVIMDDQNNELVRDIIRRELKPIKDTVQRLNKVVVEKPTSTNKQKDYKQSSNVSWDQSALKPAGAKDGKQNSSKQRGRSGKSPTNSARGRDKTPRAATPERHPKGILKQSNSNRRQGKTRSGSSSSNRSRN